MTPLSINKYSGMSGKSAVCTGPLLHAPLPLLGFGDDKIDLDTWCSLWHLALSCELNYAHSWDGVRFPALCLKQSGGSVKLPLVAALMVGVMLLSCASEQGVTVDTLLETQRMHLETVLEADKELQLDVQRAFMAWEIVLAQDRTIDWTTEELIAEIERAYLELETVGPWANSEKHSGQ